MSDTSFRLISACSNPILAFAYQKIEQQQRLLKQVQQLLPQPLADHVRHCLISGSNLLLYTESAVWASQLRFYVKIIQADLSQTYQTAIHHVQIRLLTVKTGLSQSKPVRANIPSLETINTLHAQSLTLQDPELREALLKLSRKLKSLN